MAEQLKLNPMTGEFDLVGQADSDTLSTPITGFVSGAGVITSTDTILQAINKLDGNIAASGSGTVTSVSVVTANGVSGSVATESTTPAITLSLGAITPSSVNSLTLLALTTGFSISGGTTSKTLTVSDTASVSGTNTGDQSLVSLGAEATANKVTSISSGSTDAQYPSAKLVYDQLAGKASTTTVAGKENFHGVQAVGTMAFSNSYKTLTVASITYWYKGTSYTSATPITCDLDLTSDRDNSSNTLTTNKLYFFYFKDATGKLYWSDTPWNFKENVFVASVFWNGSAGACQRETHSHTRDLDWHIWAHDTIGCRYESGFTLTNPTTTNDASLQIETGNIHDEDLDVSTGQMTTSRGWFQASSGVYTFADYSLPYVGSSGTPQYLRTSDYSLQSVGATNFAVYWVYATLDIDRPCYIVPTQAASAHNTLALARAETAPSLSGVGINPEWKLIYRFIYKGDGNFQESSDYRTTSTVGGSATASTTAGAVSFSPSGNITSTTVQTAIEELDSEKQPLDATLTALAGLDATAGFLKQTGADAFTKDTNTYLTSLSGAVLTSQSTPQTIGDTDNRLTKLWATDITVTNAIAGSVTGNSATATTAPTTAVLISQATPQTVGSTSERLLKLWATDITCTNAITGSVTGNAGTVTNGIYTTSQVTALAAADTGDKGKYLKANTSTGVLEWATISAGFTDPMTTRGDIIVRKVGGTDRLALGTSGQVLVSDGTDISWGSASTGLFDIDVNGDLEPITDTLSDDYYELDVNDDLQPKA